MKFVTNLAKGFVRSAVNQVGRDGGKVVSNQVYGNKHSTPVRIATEEEFQLHGNITIDQDGPKRSLLTRDELINSGYKPELHSSGFVLNMLLIPGSILLPVFGPLYWLLAGWRNLFKDKTKFFIINQEPVYVSDKRYKTGVRPAGYKPIKQYSEAVIPSVGNERLIYMFKGIIALIMCVAIVYFQYQMYLAIKAAL